MNTDQLKTFILTHIVKKRFNSNAHKEGFWESKHPEALSVLKSLARPNVTDIAQMVYDFLNDVKIPVCNTCKSPDEIRFLGFKPGYTPYCGSSCAQLNPEVNIKKQATNIERYGVSCVLKDTPKMQSAMLSKYGVSCPQHIEGMKDRIKQTKLDLYGDENYNNVHQAKATKLERYGDENYTNYDQVKKTNLDKYGVTSVLSLESTRIGAMQSKYGVDNPSQLESVQEKKKKSGLSTYGVLFQQKHLTRDQVDKFNDIEFLKTHKVHEIIDITGYSQSQVSKQLIKFDLLDGLRSYGERDIKQFIEKVYTGEVLTNTRSIIKPLEIDVYIPDLKFGIEFNGDWTHSVNNGKDKKSHNLKFKKASEIGVTLMQIPEHQWINERTRPILESMILNKLGINNIKIPGRKCTVKTISSQQANNFLQINHIQGACRASHRFGLFYEDELVMVMTFGKSRFSVEMELIRMSSKLQTTVVGGAQKLLKHALAIINTNIISFSDNNFSSGNFYKNSGFTFVSESIGYFYVKNGVKYNRMSTQKHKLKTLLGDQFDSSLSESDNLIANGFLKIYDAGQTKWMLKCKM